MTNNINNIQKPISMVIEESKNTIVNAINSVQLHPTLLEIIIKELYLEVQNQAKVIAENERYEYERKLSECMLENKVTE